MARAMRAFSVGNIQHLTWRRSLYAPVCGRQRQKSAGVRGSAEIEAGR
tara:strand:+ start:2323 stop:2466 length:144 start_codon:yes stop_codon:yes gene_type:complete